MKTLIKNGMIHNAVDSKPFKGDILIRDGKIDSVGTGLSCDGAVVFDAEGFEVYPGFIDAHSHIGIVGYSGKPEQDDFEEKDPCTPNLRAIDAVNPLDYAFEKAAHAGVTCVCVGPGSCGVISGTHMALKTVGRRVDDMIVKNPVAMKIAFGENTKKFGNISSRMSVSAILRETVMKTREYIAKKKASDGDASKMPPYNAKLEAMIPVVNKEIPFKAHAHRNDDIMSAIRFAREMDVNLTIEHCSDCSAISDILAKEGYPIAVGPLVSESKKQENKFKCFSNVAKLIRSGCHVSMTTDSPIIAEEFLPVCAGFLLREGISEEDALKTITINAAEHLGIQNRVGSIEVGKDADLVISKGCALLNNVYPTAVFIDGKNISKN